LENLRYEEKIRQMDAAGKASIEEYDAEADAHDKAINRIMTLDKQYTGNVIKDASDRGFKTRDEMQKTLTADLAVLAEMKAAGDKYNAAQIRAQQDRVKADQQELDGKRKLTDQLQIMSDMFNSSADAWVKISQVAGPAMSKLATVVATINTVTAKVLDD